MNRPRSRVTALAALAAAGALVMPACDLRAVPYLFAQPAPQPTIAPITRAQQARPEVAVRRGVIAETIDVLGRVVSAQEADLHFKTNGRLRSLLVETGQQVKAGQLLAELETGDLMTRILKAKADVESAQLRLEHSRGKALADNTEVDERAVRQAAMNLEQARLAQEKLLAGPTEAERRASENSVVQARLALERAQADLAAKQLELATRQTALAAREAGATLAELASAEGAVEAARIRLLRATSGPRPEDVTAAEIKLEQARTRLAQVRDAPPVKPEDIASAEIEVERAMVNLDKARTDRAGTPAQRDATVRAAMLALEIAQNRLDARRRQQVNPWDLRLAELAVTAAENDLARLTNLSPYEAELARVQHDLAVARLEALRAAPSDRDLAPLRLAVELAERAVASAAAAIPSAAAALAAAEAAHQARLNGPTEFQRREAQHRVEQAEVVLAQAEARRDLNRAALERNRQTQAIELELLRKQVERAEIVLAQLESNYADARIVAPFDGKVTKVNGRPGVNVRGFDPVVYLASPAVLLIEAQVSESHIPRLAVGQRALIRIDALPDSIFSGTVRDLPNTIVTQQGVIADRTARIDAREPLAGAQLGMLARVQLVLRQKDDVLLVPTNAIRTVGSRRFVEYLDGHVKRSRSVAIGVSTPTDTEIVSGLEEGMLILAGA